MPDISELRQSSFVTKSDLGPQGSLFTIKNVEQVNVAKEGASAELKWAANLKETDKPWVLNSTNMQIIAQFSGKRNTDHWGDLKVVLYFDPNVSYGGKLVGGIRCRQSRLQTPATPLPKPATNKPPPQGEPDFPPEPGEDVPF